MRGHPWPFWQQLGILMCSLVLCGGEWTLNRGPQWKLGLCANKIHHGWCDYGGETKGGNYDLSWAGRHFCWLDSGHIVHLWPFRRMLIWSGREGLSADALNPTPTFNIVYNPWGRTREGRERLQTVQTLINNSSLPKSSTRAISTVKSP